MAGPPQKGFPKAILSPPARNRMVSAGAFLTLLRASPSLLWFVFPDVTTLSYSPPHPWHRADALKKQEAGSWALWCPVNATSPLGPGTQPRVRGIQAVLLCRAGPPGASWGLLGPPRATWPAVSIKSPHGSGRVTVRRPGPQGWGLMRRGFPQRPSPGPAGQGHSSPRSPA